MRTTAETRRVTAYTASTWTHQGQDVGRSHRRVGANASGSRVRDREDIRDVSSPWICEWWCPDHAKRRSKPEELAGSAEGARPAQGWRGAVVDLVLDHDGHGVGRVVHQGEQLDVPVSYTHLRAHETRHDLVC